jgi:demethylmenaquinone methyltransferase/2-methoxy-6-polyprenyl-1,4-benzoquinol methylase
MNSTETIPQPPEWDGALLRDPHAAPDKRGRVQRMFAAIAPSYDLNNRVHSLGIDQLWRRKAVKLAQVRPGDVIVDVACGTGDLTLQFEAERQCLGSTGRVLGIDFTFEMLPPARRKAISIVERRGNSPFPSPGTPAAAPRVQAPWTLSNLRGADAPPNAQGACTLGAAAGVSGGPLFAVGDAQGLPLPDACADVVSIAFGIRNVADIAAALSEFRRVLRPGGRLIVLEFSLPTNPILRGLYNFYFRKILPWTATLISGDKTGAYKYLPESVNTFIGRRKMLDMMRAAGFATAEEHAMTFGVCICYRGVVAAKLKTT